ncbi:CRTAC1 family protein [Singulisphaera rosea]
MSRAHRTDLARTSFGSRKTWNPHMVEPRRRPLQTNASHHSRRNPAADRDRPNCYATWAAIGLLSFAGCGEKDTSKAVPAAANPVKTPVAIALEIPKVKFLNITDESGLKFRHANAAEGAKLLPETMGSGAAFLDYDGDGDQDILLVNSGAWPGSKAASSPTHALYRNDGKGHFEDVTAQAGLDKPFFGMGVAVGDYDNDGDPDVYITALGGGHLFRNDQGNFADVTDAAKARAGGLDDWPTSAAFFDMENDGDLDLFICSYLSWTAAFDRAQDFQLSSTDKTRAYVPPTAFKGALCQLLRNDGGVFVDVGEQAGIHVRSPELKEPVAKAMGVAPYDVDEDGLVDLAVANDTAPNFFFHNLGGGKFEEIGITSGIAFDIGGSARGAMGIDWAEFRNDRLLGLAIGNFANEMTALYVNDRPRSLQFSDLASRYGLGALSQPPLKFGLFFFDYDLDGRLDLLTANGHLENDIAKTDPSEKYEQAPQLFWNTGRPGRQLFVLIDPETAGNDLFRPVVGRGCTYADIDGDGDLDVLLSVNGGRARLFRNEGGSRNHWVRLILHGAASNRDAIGAKVALEIGGTEQRRQLFPSKGYLSSVEAPLTFGLGAAGGPVVISITWPSGKTTEHKGLTADRVYHIDEGKGLR